MRGLAPIYRSTQPSRSSFATRWVRLPCSSIEPGLDDSGLVAELIEAAERYLRSRGAQVLYAGGLFPLNPFYWGLYGGSEGAGVLSGDERFHRALRERGYEPVGTTVLLEADMSVPESRDPRSAMIRRLTHVEYLDDSLPADWWQNVALGEFQLLSARLLLKADGTEVAHAQAWDMSWFGREDGQTRIGLINVEVPPDHRRKGYARFLMIARFSAAPAKAWSPPSPSRRPARTNPPWPSTPRSAFSPSMSRHSTAFRPATNQAHKKGTERKKGTEQILKHPF